MFKEKLLKLQENVNIANDLDDDELAKIGQRASQGFDIDERSREEWLNSVEEAKKIANQVMESKSTPWPNAANVKYPLISSAIISFASRTYPEIVRNDKVVLAGVIGPDPDGKKEDIAKRVSDHMSYQCLVESPNWERDTDKLLHILPLMGVVYRKSYFDEFLRIPATDLCLPDKITVNNHISSLETARRITHQLDLYENDLIERMRLGIYKEYNLDEMRPTDADGDEDPTFPILEQHTFADLDGDGYKEPYIVTFHRDTKKIFRIRSRFDLEDIIFNEKGEIVRITPVNYFTDYHFIPCADGTWHSKGYGSLLYPINETINTTVNQLLDAGTLSNRQSGFLGKQLRMGKGPVIFRPGEWKTVETSSGVDLKNNIVPLPVREPSAVLMSLLTMMIGAGEKLASVTDILEGQQPAQNAPATSVLALLEQGLKDQKAIVKRLHKSFTKEYQKQARLNKLYLDESYYDTFTGEENIRADDYATKKLMVFPVADPNMSSDAQRMARAQALMALGNDPDINSREVKKRYFEALQVPNIEKLFKPLPDPNAPPPPEIEKIMSEIHLNNMKAKEILMNAELEALRLEVNQQMNHALMAEMAARIQKMADDVKAKYAEIIGKFNELALKKAELTYDMQQQTEVTPPEEEIDRTPIDIDEAMAQFREQPVQPPAPPEPPAQPEMPPAPEAEINVNEMIQTPPDEAQVVNP